MRTYLYGAAATLLGCSVVAAIILPAPNHPSKVTRANFDLVQEEMTEAEVEAILGPPGDYNTRPCHIILEHGITFRRYWYGDEGAVIIELGWPDSFAVGAAGCVNNKEFLPLPTESYMARWWRLIRYW